MSESVNHPKHYGGQHNPFEAIKVIEAWQLGFNLGNTVKYISRAGKKDKSKELEDLKKALWYLQREIDNLVIQQNNKEAMTLMGCELIEEKLPLIVEDKDELFQLIDKNEIPTVFKQVKTQLNRDKLDKLHYFLWFALHRANSINKNDIQETYDMYTKQNNPTVTPDVFKSFFKPVKVQTAKASDKRKEPVYDLKRPEEIPNLTIKNITNNGITSQVYDYLREQIKSLNKNKAPITQDIIASLYDNVCHIANSNGYKAMVDSFKEEFFEELPF